MEWYQGAIVFAVAFGVAYLMVPASKWLAVRIGAIDYPSDRRMNSQAIPRCGGVALYIGLVAAALTVVVGVDFFGWELHDLYVLFDVDYILLFCGITAMFGVGLVDDIMQLAPWQKLLGQLAAATVIAASGISIGTVRAASVDSYWNLGFWDYPITVLYLIVFVNITNLIDGLDGLAAGVAAIVSISLMVLVYSRGSFTLVLASLALCAVCLAFLRFNFHPASVFMGDSGSHLLGVMLGIVAVAGIVRTQGVAVMLVPIIIAGIPALDTVLAIVRRRIQHESISHADANHIHHRLVHTGMGQRKAVAILWACSAVLAVAGVLVGSFSGPMRWGIVVGLIVTVFAIIWKFGLIAPVVHHHYVNRGRRGPRLPHKDQH